MEKIKGQTEYVYEILEEGECIYVGKTMDPFPRFRQHLDGRFKHLNTLSLVMRIIDKYEDLESKWIQTRISEGYSVDNKKKKEITSCDSFSIGDVIYPEEIYRTMNIEYTVEKMVGRLNNRKLLYKKITKGDKWGKLLYNIFKTNYIPIHQSLFEEEVVEDLEIILPTKWTEVEILPGITVEKGRGQSHEYGEIIIEKIWC